ncbi:hypothetical protein DFH08DRAFT_978443 [Mycena albidolilacea]|uniref:Ribonuclease H1 N-terminal domain-containing protein n=1 Tax=Mycena albidolilacea TaxID=1033008 RepID=A0AAD6YYJ5_9AGAR|nr:hypothetical protein DFH08DRAFT_978443 [Mycena albidolilacea]
MNSQTNPNFVPFSVPVPIVGFLKKSSCFSPLGTDARAPHLSLPNATITLSIGSGISPDLAASSTQVESFMQLPLSTTTMNPVPDPTLQPPPTNPRRELMVVLANVDHLVVRAQKLTRAAEQIPAVQILKALPAILNHLNEEEAEGSRYLVRAVAKTPAQVAAEHANVPDGTQQWWIVYVGREPGIYSTLEMATAQTEKCPNQQWRSWKGGKREALDFYHAWYDANEVVKWVELNP